MTTNPTPHVRPAIVLGSLKPGSELRRIWPDGAVALKRAEPLREFDMETGHFIPDAIYLVDLRQEPEVRVQQIAFLAARWWRMDARVCLQMIRDAREVAVPTNHFAGVCAPVSEAKPKTTKP